MRELVDEAAKVTVEDRSYVGVVLDAASHKRLLAWWKDTVKIPLLDRVFAHHQTIIFKPTPEELADLPLDTKTRLRVTHWAADAKAQAVEVSSKFPNKGSAHAHITVAVSPGTPPVYSNALLAAGRTRVYGPYLSGTVQYVQQLIERKRKV